MRNDQIANVFEELADRLELSGEQRFRVASYRTAADTIRACDESVERLAAADRAQELDGVGPAIAEKLAALAETGTFPALDAARAEIPDGMVRLLGARGVGVATARTAWLAANADDWDGFVARFRAGALEGVKGISAPARKGIAALLDAVPDKREVWLRDAAQTAAERLLALCTDQGAIAGGIGGGLARGEEVISRARTWVTASDPNSFGQALRSHADEAGWEVGTVEHHDSPHAHVQVTLRAPSGVACVLDIAPVGHDAVAALLAVGPESHARTVLELARTNGGTDCTQWQSPATATANTLHGELAPDAPAYAAAELQWVPYELRHQDDIIDRAKAATIPRLVQVGDLVNELHCHSTWSDGKHSIHDMATAAAALGLKEIAITDHSAPYALVNGLDAARLREQRKEIAAVQAEFGTTITILQGSEIEILAQGGLGLDADTIAALDWAVASLHMDQRQPGEQITARTLEAVRAPGVRCIGHPTSRLLAAREATALDVDAMIAAAAETGTGLEINANPRRLDLGSEHARQAAAAGVRLSINTDAHSTDGLAVRHHGVAVARRAGLTSNDIINCTLVSGVGAAS